MISSIVVTKCCKIGMNTKQKIKVDNTLFSIEKDIPFIRYRLGKYGEAEVEYIKRMMEQFKYSTHLVELEITENLPDEIRLLEGINLAKYLYTDITNDDVLEGNLKPAIREILHKIDLNTIDRLMFKDKSSILDLVNTRKIGKILKDEFRHTLFSESNIGVCSSPLSFGELACLTAVKARELMSRYSDIADVALPSANHQCMNCCGCIRYMIIDKDLEAPLEPKNNKKEKKTEVKIVKDNEEVEVTLSNNKEEEKKKKTSTKKKKVKTLKIGNYYI